MSRGFQEPQPLQIIQDRGNPEDKAIFVKQVMGDDYLIVRPYYGVGDDGDAYWWEASHPLERAVPNPEVEIETDWFLVVSYGVARVAFAADNKWHFWYVNNDGEFGYGPTGEVIPFGDHTQVVCQCNPKGLFKKYERGPDWTDVILERLP